MEVTAHRASASPHAPLAPHEAAVPSTPEQGPPDAISVGATDSFLSGALAVFALVEFALLRSFLRSGQFMPESMGLNGLYAVVKGAGLAAMNLAILLALALLGRLALAALAEPKRGARALGGLVLAAAAVQAGLALGLGRLLGPGALLLAIALFLAGLIAACLIDRPRRERWLAVAFLAPYAAVSYYYLAQPATGYGAAPPLALQTYFAAEALAVGAAIALPILIRARWNGRTALAVALLSALLLLGRAGRPWLLATVAMWNFAFSMYLPAVAYAIAFGAYAYGLVALWREGSDGRRRAHGLVLILLAGLKLDYSYFGLLALAGYLLLTLPPSVGRSRSPAPGPVCAEAGAQSA